MLEETKLRLTQPSLAGTGAELGKNKEANSDFRNFIMPHHSSPLMLPAAPSILPSTSCMFNVVYFTVFFTPHSPSFPFLHPLTHSRTKLNTKRSTSCEGIIKGLKVCGVELVCFYVNQFNYSDQLRLN